MQGTPLPAADNDLLKLREASEREVSHLPRVQEGSPDQSSVERRLAALELTVDKILTEVKKAGWMV